MVMQGFTNQPNSTSNWLIMCHQAVINSCDHIARFLPEWSLLILVLLFFYQCTYYHWNWVWFVWWSIYSFSWLSMMFSKSFLQHQSLEAWMLLPSFFLNFHFCRVSQRMVCKILIFVAIDTSWHYSIFPKIKNFWWSIQKGKSYLLLWYLHFQF